MLTRCIRQFTAVTAAVATLTVSVTVAYIPQTFAEDDALRFADAARDHDFDTVRALLKQGADVNAFGLDGTPALHWAVNYEDIAMTQELIAAGADVNLLNRYDLPALYIAASTGNVEMMKVLLDAGANPNAHDKAGESMLMAAAQSGGVEAVKLLLDNEAEIDAREPDFEQTALMFAVRENDVATVKLLIERGANVDAQTVIGPTPANRLPGAGGGSHGDGIVRGGWPEQGMRNPISGGKTPLLYAARDGRLESAKLLLDAGADIEKADPNGMTPLLFAIINDHMPLAKMLIERGANINVVDWYGESPLWAAVDARNMAVDSGSFEQHADRDGGLEIIKLLIEKGADVNHRVKEYPPIRRWLMGLGSLAWVDFTGQTPFLRAALSGDVTVMKLLLEHGADPNVPTYNGTTALMAAAGVNWVVNETFDEGSEALLEAVKLCHSLGNEINATNSMGLAAIHGAANRGSDNIIEYLAENGADLTMKDEIGRTPMAWAEGVFLATHAPQPKPSSIALLKRLLGETDKKEQLVSSSPSI